MANLWLQWFNYNNVFLLLFVVKLWLIFIRVVSSSLLLFLYLLRDEDSEVTGPPVILFTIRNRKINIIFGVNGIVKLAPAT